MSDGLPRDLVDVITKAIRGHMSDVHVAIPGRVLRYDNTANTADVEVQVKQAVWDDDNRREYETLPVLPAVPVQWPRAGGFMVTMPLAKDDMVLLVFNDAAIGEWRNSGEVSEPWDGRRHSIGYPVAIPGFFPDVTPLPDASARAAGMVLGKAGSDEQIRIGSASVEIGTTGTFALGRGSAVEDLINNIMACTPSQQETGLAAIKLFFTTNYGTVPVAAALVKTTLLKAK